MSRRTQILSHTSLLTGHYRWTATRTRVGPSAAGDGGELLSRLSGSDDWHAILTLRGRGVVGTLAPRIAAPPRRIVLWRPGVPQCYAVAPGASAWERLWVHFQPPPEWLDLLAWPEVEPGLMAVDLSRDGYRAVRSALAKSIAHDHGGTPDRIRMAMNSLELALLLIAREVAGAGVRDSRIDRLVKLIDAELAAEWSLARMASAAGTSTAQLVRLCGRHLGESPRRLLERLRLDHACRCLERDDTPVAHVAAAVGFPDASHFIRRFRARFTVTPARWRRGRRSGELVTPPDLEHRGG